MYISIHIYFFHFLLTHARANERGSYVTANTSRIFPFSFIRLNIKMPEGCLPGVVQCLLFLLYALLLSVLRDFHRTRTIVFPRFRPTIVILLYNSPIYIHVGGTEAKRSTRAEPLSLPTLKNFLFSSQFFSIFAQNLVQFSHWIFQIFHIPDNRKIHI